MRVSTGIGERDSQVGKTGLKGATQAISEKTGEEGSFTREPRAERGMR